MRQARWPLAAACVALLGSSAVQAASELKDWHKSEVSVLMSKDDEKAFKKLKDDTARQQWADEFWKKLDPTPDAAPNEAQDEFQKRVEFAAKNMGEGGWKNDMGKVLLIFGPPASAKEETSGKKPSGGPSVESEDQGISTDVEGIDETRSDPDSGEAPSAGRRGEKRVMLWTYTSGNPGLGGNTELRFESSGSKIVLKTKGVELTPASFVASLPKPGAAPAADVAAAPATGSEAPTSGEAPPAAVPDDPITAELKQILKEKKLSTAIPLKSQPFYFPSPDGNVYIPLAVKADFSAIPASGPRTVHVFGAVLQGETVVREFVLKHTGTGDLLAKAEVVAPGTYDLLIGLRDEASSTYGLIQIPLQTPDFSQPSLSSVLLSPAMPEQGEPVPDILNTVTEAVHLGPYKFQPYFNNELKSSDAVNLFYFVMKTGADETGTPKLGVKYSLEQGGEAKGKYNIPELASSVIAHPLDVAKHKLKAGNYELKMEVKDAIGGSTLTQTIPLVIQ